MTGFGLFLTVLAGAGLGLGLTTLAAGLRPAPAPLAARLAFLGAAPDTPSRAPAWQASLRVIASRFVVPRAELALLGRSVENYIVLKAGCVLLGLAMPLLLAFLFWAAGMSFPIYIPAGLSLALGAVFFIVVDVDIRQKANRARREFRYAVCSYLDLVALQRAVGRAPGESLERAADNGGGWVFDRLRSALRRAAYEHRPPWEALRDVGDDLGIPVLADLGAIMQMAGEEGAHSYRTLRSLADGLRATILAEEQTRANSDTTVLTVPSTALLAVLFGLAAYPMLARLLFN